MKQFKLKIHQQNYSDALLIFNTSDLPDVKTFDLLKIHHCNGSANDFVLVQVLSLKDGEMAKDTISIEATLAQSFGLKVFQDVYVYKTEPEDVALDLFEVSFKDQYISRSDMWRMKKTFLNSCVYIDQYLPFLGIRAQVSELWSNSTKVRCGYITDNTNFVLRSYTAEVYVFIQMSSEMWEYDAYGYLQFERAINGFLKALFKKWKQKKCCHELTLVLFSRTLYKTQDIEDFPIHLRDCLRRNYQNQLYMDFYKCVVQTERLEDCTSLITTLKRLFNKYEKLTELDGCPKGINSTSSEGNFLEAINLSLNVFEQHHINRNFDRTGQIVVCITPGVGVFDVDRKLTVLTKERMIDNGIGSDLICLGQQPLHAVPLFKFHCDQQRKKNTSFPKRENFPTSNSSDFNIPHWINHSFYTSNPFPDEGTTNINYIPRIRHPIMKVKEKSQVPTLAVNNVTNKDSQLPSLQHINYDEFDNQVFKYQQPLVKRRNGNESIVFKHNKFKNEDLFNMETPTSEDDLPSRPLTRPVHIPITKQHNLLNNQTAASSLGSNDYYDRYRPNNEKTESCLLVGSAHAGHGHLSKQHVVAGNSRALFNPFKPSHMYARLTANRRRWVHTYPRGPQGEALVLHHLQSREKQSRSREISESYENETVINASCASLESPVSYKASFSTQHALGGTDGVSLSSSLASSNPSSSSNDNLDTLLQNSSLHKGMRLNKPISSYGFSWMWGIAGDLQWTSQTNTGLDWKSLKCPACLPITTDYCPSSNELEQNYTEQSYPIIPDDSNYDYENQNDENSNKMNQERSSREIFRELINQRLCQGFQIIKQMKRKRNHNSTGSSMTIVSPNLSEVSFRSFTGTSPLSARGMIDTDGYADSYMLSHGRQYHQLTLSKDKEKINVTIYKPRHPFTTVTVPYTYMLWPKTRDKYQTSQISFSHTKLPDFYWNHLDVYVCNPDENDFQLSSNVNYWQSNFILLPTPSKRLNIIKQANKQNVGEWRYDVFDRCNCERSHDNTMDDGECAAMCDSFLRFLDHMNKIKRNHSQTSRKSWRNQCSSAAHIKSIQSSPTPTQIVSSTQTTPTPPTRSSTPSSGQSTPLRQDEVTTPPVISGRLLQGVDAQPVPLHLKSGSDNGSSSSGNSPIQKLTVHSELVDIVKGMKDKQNGLNFMADNVDLPMFTFISIEAVNWCIANVGGLVDLKDACLLLETMCKSKLLIHASQDSHYPFVYGYVFYCINEEFINNQNSDIDDPTSYQYGVVSYLLHNFHKRWFEVEISRKNLNKSSTSLLLSSSNSQKSAFYTKPTSYSSPRRKTFSPDKNNLVKLPLANQLRTNRSEWCHVKYKNRTNVGVDNFVFCFELQWLVATATCIYHMLQVWQRESTRCDLYLCPVPNDPFAFPSSEVTGPLRFPLFVPLNLHAMANSSLFQDYKGDEYRDFIISWMEGIVLRFGFLRDNFEGTNDYKENLKSRSYVHFTGQVFVQIPVYHHVVQRRSVSYRNRPPKLNTVKMANASENISQEELDSTGFYWSSNYMQTKRWRIQSLDDCQPQDLERDFVNFCSNEDHRLVSFFEEFNNDFK